MNDRTTGRRGERARGRRREEVKRERTIERGGGEEGGFKVEIVW